MGRFKPRASSVEQDPGDINGDTAATPSAAAPTTEQEVTQRDEDWVTKFSPKEGICYGWVVKYARDLWQDQLAIYQKLEDKAGSVITWVGGGTGVFAFTALAGVYKGDISRWVALASVAPFLLGVVATAIALLARGANQFTAWLPGVREAASWAETEGGQKGVLPDWNLATRELLFKSTWRSRMNNRSLVVALAAILSLLAPLVTAISIGPVAIPTIPTTIEQTSASPATKDSPVAPATTPATDRK